MALLRRVRNVLGISQAEQRLLWWPAGPMAVLALLAVSWGGPASAAKKDSAEGPFQTFRVEMTSFWAWNRTLTIKGDGTYRFQMQTLEPIPGEKRLRPSKTPYVTSYRLSPDDLRELARLLNATQWLATPASPGPVATDSTTYAMTLGRNGLSATRKYHEGDKVQAYVDLVQFLRRIDRQEEFLFAVTHRDTPLHGIHDLGDELDGLMGVGSRAKPHAPALDYHRLMPAYGKFLTDPQTSSKLAIDAAKLAGYLKVQTQRKNLEALATGRSAANPSVEVRAAAVHALGMLGAEASLEALKEAGLAEGGPSDAVAEALLTAPPDRAVPILAAMTANSQGAAWALIRFGQSAEAAIVNLLGRPSKEHVEDRGAYLLVRAYHDHWKELPAPPGPAVVTAIHQLVEIGGDASMAVEYGTKVLSLAGRPYVRPTVRQALQQYLSLMTQAAPTAHQKRLLAGQFLYNNAPPDGFLDAARQGKLNAREVYVRRQDAWAHLSTADAQTHYTVLLFGTPRMWWIVAAWKVSQDKVQADRDKFLGNHPGAAREEGDESKDPETTIRWGSEVNALQAIVERLLARVFHRAFPPLCLSAPPTSSFGRASCAEFPVGLRGPMRAGAC